MPLTFGIPLGLIILVAGTVLYFATRYKKAAKVVIGVGLFVTLLTFILIVLALNSNM